MSTPTIIMWVMVACVGLPAALRLSFNHPVRNPTALALSVLWLVSEYLDVRGVPMLPKAFVVDIAVVTVIFAKAIVREGCRIYPTPRMQFTSAWRALTGYDRAVLALYLVGAWPLYVSTLHAYYVYWALFYITVAQFLLVGMEAATSWFRAGEKQAKPPPENILHFAPAYSRRVRKYVGAEPMPCSVTPLMKRAGGDG